MAKEDGGGRVKRAREAQRLVNAYHRVFGSEAGALVLEDLRREFRVEERVFTPVGRGDHFVYDPLTAALTDGGRAVVLHILEKLKARVRSDAEVETAAVEVVK